MSEKNPLPFAKTQSKAMLPWVSAVLIVHKDPVFMQPAAEILTADGGPGLQTAGLHRAVGRSGQGIFGGRAWRGVEPMIHLQWACSPRCSVPLSPVVSGVAGGCVGDPTYRHLLHTTWRSAGMFTSSSPTPERRSGGDNGLLSVPRPQVRNVAHRAAGRLADARAFYGFVAVLFLLIFIGARRVIASPFGSTLMAIRENETRAGSAIGYDDATGKILVFVLPGAVTGIAGALYAMLLHFVLLSNIDLAMSENILIMTIVGGTGSLFGLLLGAGSIVLLGDFLWDSRPRWMMLLGADLILVVIFMRGGLWGGLPHRRMVVGLWNAGEGAPWSRAGGEQEHASIL